MSEHRSADHMARMRAARSKNLVDIDPSDPQALPQFRRVVRIYYSELKGGKIVAPEAADTRQLEYAVTRPRQLSTRQQLQREMARMYTIMLEHPWFAPMVLKYLDALERIERMMEKGEKAEKAKRGTDPASENPRRARDSADAGGVPEAPRLAARAFHRGHGPVDTGDEAPVSD